MFLRTKTIKGKPYCYAIENKWTSKGSRQRKSKYLGRIIKCKSITKKQFNLKRMNTALYDLITWELEKLNTLAKYDARTNQILIDGKKVVLAINDGYLCQFTIRRIKRFKPTGDTEIDGYKLAKLFVEAGIGIPEDIFVKYIMTQAL